MSNEKACKNCGKQINADFKFCPYCESKIEEQNFSENNSNEKVCKNCGKTIKSDFNVCPYCGNKIENQTINENLNEKICKSCGKSINANFKVCPYCGNNAYNDSNFSDKNSMVALILMVCLGWAVCAHRFYVGRIKEATVFLIANLSAIIIAGAGFLPILIYIIIYLIGIWLFDLIKLMKGEFKDSEGKYLKKL